MSGNAASVTTTGQCYCDSANGYAPTFNGNTDYDSGTYFGTCELICTTSNSGANECWDTSGTTPTSTPSSCFIDSSNSNSCRCDESNGYYGDGSGACVQICVSNAGGSNCWDTTDTTGFPYSNSQSQCLDTANVCSCDASSGYIYTFDDSDHYFNANYNGLCVPMCTISSSAASNGCYGTSGTGSSTAMLNECWADTTGACTCSVSTLDGTVGYVGADDGTCQL